MLIIGCDYHPSFEQIAFLDTATGEQGQARLDHRTDEVERFYAGLCSPVRVGRVTHVTALSVDTETFYNLWVPHSSPLLA